MFWMDDHSSVVRIRGVEVMIEILERTKLLMIEQVICKLDNLLSDPSYLRRNLVAYFIKVIS